ncbi:MAG: sulfatase-like hydrolase/transferase [Chitinophagaceae bacterium]
MKKIIPESFFTRYVFVLPFLMITAGACLIVVFRKKYPFIKLTAYLNLIIVFFIISDIIVLLYRAFEKSPNRVVLLNGAAVQPCDSCAKPDVYFLVFDEYGSSASLKKEYGYDNSQLDTFLTGKGFNIQQQSVSNYNWTQFSMASILNMSYLSISDPNALVFQDYLHAERLIRNNKVVAFFKSEGYQVEGISIFDFEGDNKAVLEDNLASPRSRLITQRTFVNVVLNDIGWRFLQKKINWGLMTGKYNERFDNIQLGIDLIKKSAHKKSNTPRFVYGHLLMPHAPFYMDKQKRQVNVQKMMGDAETSSTKAYVNYLYYTNLVIIDIIETIRTVTNDQAVIILMGDHGFRPPTDLAFPVFYFQNLNAVYYPGKKNTLFYSNVSGVNQFRIVLNDLFKQHLPLLQDSMIYLKDKK